MYPSEAWLLISRYLSVREICILQLCCRYLRDIMQDSFVWYYALVDLRELHPFPDSMDIERMSGTEMHRMCVRIAQVYKRWLGRQPSPPVIHEAECGTVRDIKLLPGGKHFVVVELDGSLALHSMHKATDPVKFAGDFYLEPDERDPATALHLQTIETSTNAAFVLYHIRSPYSESYLVHSYDGNTLVPRIRVPQENALGFAFHADGNKLRATYLRTTHEGSLGIQTIHVWGGNTPPWTQISPLVILHVPCPTIGVAQVHLTCLAPQLPLLTWERMDENDNERVTERRWFLFHLPVAPNVWSPDTPWHREPVWSGEAEAIPGDVFTRVRPSHLPSIHSGTDASHSEACAPLWSLMSPQRNAEFTPTIFAHLFGDAEFGEQRLTVSMHSEALAFSELYRERWHETLPRLARCRHPPDSRVIDAQSRVGRMFTMRLYSRNLPGGRRECALMTSQTFSPHWHASFLSGHGGYMRLEQDSGAPPQMSTLPGGIIDINYPDEYRPVKFDTDEAAGLVAIVSERRERDGRSGHGQRAVVRVHSIVDSDLWD